MGTALLPIILPGFRIAELDGRTSSEVVADLMPGARLVKAGNTLPPELLSADPRQSGGQRVLFFSGDDAAARADVGALIDRLGFFGIDLGPIAVGGKLVEFPGGPLPLRIFEPRYLDMVSRCLREQAGFAVVLLGEGEEAEEATSFAATGTEARIVDFDRLEGGLLGISCIGRERVRVVEAWRAQDGLNRGRVLDIPADPVVPVPSDQSWLAEVVQQVLPEAEDTYRHVERRDDAAWVGNRLAELLPLSLADRQALLELADPLERLAVLEPAVTRNRG